MASSPDPYGQRLIETPRTAVADRLRTGRPTAATSVYEKLRRDILAGLLKPGEKLRIDFCSTLYAVGANPVREALNRLSAERLVDREDQRGFFVAPVSLERLRELVQTRCWLESRALEESIRRRDQAWEERLVLAHHHLSRTRWDLPGEGRLVGDPEWERRHRAFHRALIGACGSSWLIRFCEEMMDQAERYRHIAISSTFPSRIVNDEHKSVMEAALDGKVELATGLLCDHYRLTLAIIERQTAD